MPLPLPAMAAYRSCELLISSLIFLTHFHIKIRPNYDKPRSYGHKDTVWSTSDGTAGAAAWEANRILVRAQGEHGGVRVQFNCYFIIYFMHWLIYCWNNSFIVCCRYWHDNGLPIFLRNLVAAPITEELVFRSLLVPILTIAYAAAKDPVTGEHLYSPYSIMIRCPLWFAMAHVHHFIEKISSGEKVTFAVLGTLLQMTYTSIFGYIAAAFLMRTGNVYAPITSHMYCNYWGLPNIDFMFPPSKNRPSDLSFLYPYRYFLLAAHALGLLLFAVIFAAATEPLTRESVFYSAFHWGKY